MTIIVIFDYSQSWNKGKESLMVESSCGIHKLLPFSYIWFWRLKGFFSLSSGICSYTKLNKRNCITIGSLVFEQKAAKARQTDRHTDTQIKFVGATDCDNKPFLFLLMVTFYGRNVNFVLCHCTAIGPGSSWSDDTLLWYGYHYLEARIIVNTNTKYTVSNVKYRCIVLMFVGIHVILD